MKIAVLSDIHGNLHALEAVREDLSTRGVDAVVNLGDSLSGPLLPLETARFLMSKDWTHLAGNHERQLLELDENSNASDKYAHSQLTKSELDWIAAQTHVMRFADGDVLLCHGSPRSDVEALLENGDRAASVAEIAERLGETDSTLLLCGHSHVPRSVRTKCRALIVNPGSVGLQAYFEKHPFPHRVENGAPDARYAIVEKKGAVWQSSLISVPYDFREMARLARVRGRDDWAVALETGYVGIG